MASGRGFPPPSAIVNVNHNPRAWICQGRKCDFFRGRRPRNSRAQAEGLTGRREETVEGNGCWMRLGQLFWLQLAAWELAVRLAGLLVAGATGLATFGGPPPRQRTTGWWGAGCGLTGGCRNYVMADSSENAKMQKLPFPEFA